MKIIRLALLSFISLFAVVWIISLFIPSKVRISRATEISAPADSLRRYLGQPESWRIWYPNLDSAQDYVENGEVRGVFSEKGGYRKLVLDEVRQDEIRTRYIVGDRKPVLSGWTLHPSPGTKPVVTVQWYMDFNLRWYPWEKFASLVFEKTYGPMMEEGLNRLKKAAEASRP